MLIGIIGIFSSQMPLWKVDSTFGCQLFPIQHNLRKEVKIMENINDIKNKIRQLIYEKNVLAHKFSFYNDDEQHKKALESCKFDAFRISRDEFRTVDKIRVVDGKKTWLSKIVIN